MEKTSNKLEELRLQISEAIMTTLEMRPQQHPIILIFGLAILFEERFGEEEKSINLQVGTIALSKLIKDIFRKKDFQIPEASLEDLQIQMLKYLEKVDHEGIDPNLSKLFGLYENESFLNQLEQTHDYDQSCEVFWYEEGCMKSRIKDIGGILAYRRDGLKYGALSKFYFNKGKWEALEQVKNGMIILKGAKDDDLVDNFAHVAHQVAAFAYLRHYGIEENFSFKEKTYRTSLLVQSLSFLINYADSRYGQVWDRHADEHDTVTRIFKVWHSNYAKEGRETPGPLFLSSWKGLTERLHQVMRESWSIEEIDSHLALLSVQLEDAKSFLNISETPLLRIGDWVLFLARPLMTQNCWIPILNPLIRTYKGIQPEGAQGRNEHSTEGLAKRFRNHGFTVLPEVDLVLPEGKKKITDVDIFALKDNYLFLIQIKMTFPSLTQKDAFYHRSKALKKGITQTEESLVFLKEHWTHFWQQHSEKGLPSDLTWDKLKVVPLIVSTSLEWDHTHLGGFLKISQFELERYLENDAYYLHLPDEEEILNIDWQGPHLFYPKKEQLSGEKLKSHIENNTLWGYLEPLALSKPVEQLLFSFCLPNTKASKAQEHFTKGNDWYEKEEFDKAALQFRKAIQLFPHEEEYHKGLGNALAMQGKRRKSLQHFDQAIEINPFFGEAYNARGLTYQELHDYHKAYLDFQKATEYSPHDITAWHHLAQLQVYRGEKWSSLQLIEEGVRYADKGLVVFQQLDAKDQERFEATALQLTILINRN